MKKPARMGSDRHLGADVLRQPDLCSPLGGIHYRPDRGPGEAGRAVGVGTGPAACAAGDRVVAAAPHHDVAVDLGILVAASLARGWGLPGSSPGRWWQR